MARHRPEQRHRQAEQPGHEQIEGGQGQEGSPQEAVPGAAGRREGRSKEDTHQEKPGPPPGRGIRNRIPATRREGFLALDQRHHRALGPRHLDITDVALEP